MLCWRVVRATTALLICSRCMCHALLCMACVHRLVVRHTAADLLPPHASRFVASVCCATPLRLICFRCVRHAPLHWFRDDRSLGVAPMQDVRVDTKLNKFLWSQGIKGVPGRVRVRLARKRNDDEEAAEKLFTLCMHVPVERYQYKGLQTTVVDE